MRRVVVFAIVLFAGTWFAGAASAQNVIQLKSNRTPEQRAAAFDAADADKTGKLDMAEFRKALPPEILAQLTDDLTARLFDERDIDFDRLVSRDEFMSTAPVALHH